MTHFRSISQIAFGAFIALVSSTQTAANNDFRQIADYFAIPLDPLIDYQQQPSLGRDYTRYFKSTGDFNYQTANKFGMDNPQLVAPLRSYLQQLVDDGYIGQATALTSLRGATLGAAMTFNARQQAMIERPAQRDARDEREMSNNLYADQIQASMDEKLDGVSERVDALARLSNLSEAHLNDQQIEANSKMESIQAEFDIQMQELEEVVIARVNMLDQQLGTLSDKEFKQEISSVLRQMDLVRQETSEQSQSIQKKVDNALFEIFAQISKSLSTSEQREQQFIDNELRLFRDTSDLRARIKALEEALESKPSRPETSMNDPALPANKAINDPSMDNQAALSAMTQPAQESKSVTVEQPSELKGAARVTSTPASRKREVLSPDSTSEMMKSDESLLITELGIGVSAQSVTQQALKLKTTYPGISALVSRREGHGFAEFEISAFSGSSSIDGPDGDINFESVGIDGNLATGVTFGGFDPVTLNGNETRAGIEFEYTKFASGSNGIGEDDQTNAFFEHTYGNDGIATRHRVATSLEGVNDYVSYLFSTLISLPSPDNHGNRLEVGLGFMKDQTTESIARGVNIEFVKALEH
jgi:hypothetical protein